MARIDYYRKERSRHPALNAPCSFNDAKTVITLLSKEYGVHVAGVERTSGVRKSHYRAYTHEIRLNCDCLVWRTVLHEFAHALDHKTQFQQGQITRRHKWHTAAHAEWMDILARKVVERGWIAGIPAARLARENAKLRVAAMENDPAVIREKKIEKRKAQIDRLEAARRRCAIREAALTTRLRNARRSLAALERAAGKFTGPVEASELSTGPFPEPEGLDPSITLELPVVTLEKEVTS